MPQRDVICQECGTTFLFIGRGWCKRCPDCREENGRQRSYKHAVKTGRIKSPGVGSGGAQWGESNHTWKGGIAAYRRIARQRGFRCERCGKIDISSRLCAHHRDHDRANGSPDNLMMVCKACHQNVEHPLPRGKGGRFTSRNQIAEKTGEIPERDNPT